jgi:MFS family permease
MSRFNVHGLGFTLFLALLTALPALSIDMVLPGISLIQAEFHAPQTEAASVIAIFIAGFSSAPIVVGPLADRFGRRAIMTAGLALFTVCGPERSAFCRGRSSAICSRAARRVCSSPRFQSYSASRR